MPVDLLVFGPHPDDLEIGLGGTIARHAALGLTVGPVRSDRRRDGQQRHGRRAAGGSEAAREVLGAAWRENLRWPDRRIGKDPAHLEQAVAFIRRHRPRTSRCRTGPIAIPITSPRASC